MRGCDVFRLRCRNETNFADDKEFEEKIVNELSVYEALPLKVLYKNYVLRKLEFIKMCNYSIDVDLSEFMKF